MRRISMLASLNPSRGILSSNTGKFLVQGAAFSSSKTLFKNDTWFDEKGEFSLKKASFDTISSALYGGAVSIPTGYLSSKIAGVLIDKSSRLGAGLRTSLVISGTTSGYGTGFLLGSTTALIEGRTAPEILKAGNDAGLVSALSGAFIMSLSPLRHSAMEAAPAKELEALMKQGVARRNDDDAVFEARFLNLSNKLDKRLNMANRQELENAQVLERSANYELQTKPVHVLKEDVPLGSVPLFSHSAYLAWVTKKEPWQLRVYKNEKEGLGPLYIKHDYASELDSHVAGLTNKYSRAEKPHHVDLIDALAKVPDPSLIKQVEMRPDLNISTLWHRRANHDPFMNILANTNMKGKEISFSIKGKALGQEGLQGLADHEWAHLLEAKTPRQRGLFEIASALESKGYYVSNYAKHNSSENWAEHSSSFLGSNFSFLEFVQNAPLRAVTLSRAMGRAVDNRQIQQPDSADPGLIQRLKFTEEKIMPKALGLLRLHMKSPDKAEAARAAMLFGALAPERQLALLNEAAAGSKFLRAAAFSSLVSRLDSNRYLQHGYERTLVSSGQNELKGLLFHHLSPANGSYSRNYAISGLANQMADANLSPLLSQDPDRAEARFREYFAYFLR